eukprot:g35640.t1
MDKLCQVKEAPEAEYEVLLVQFAGGVIVALEEAQDGHVTQGVGGRAKMVSDRKVVLIIVYKVQMLHELVPKSVLGLINVEGGHIGSNRYSRPGWRMYRGGVIIEGTIRGDVRELALASVSTPYRYCVSRPLIRGFDVKGRSRGMVNTGQGYGLGLRAGTSAE